MAEYKDWLQEDVDSYTQHTYEKAFAKLEKIKHFEMDLVGNDTSYFFIVGQKFSIISLTCDIFYNLWYNFCLACDD